MSSLPNIIGGRFLVPEFLQDDAQPENLTQTIATYLDDRRLSSLISEEFTRMHEAMRCNAAERAAAALAPLIGESA